MAVSIQFKDGAFFRIDSVEDTIVEDVDHQVFGAFHIYSFHVRAKFVVPGANTTVTNPKAHAAYTSSGSTTNMDKPMTKIDPANAVDRWWKTTEKFTIAGGPNLPGTVISVFADAAFVTSELQSGDIITYTL